MNHITPHAYIHPLQLPEISQAAGLFGVHIPFLPDFLADHTLLGQQDSERLSESLGRLERLIVGLRKYRDAAYALRFTAFPEMGLVNIDLLGRFLAQPNQVVTYARHAARDLQTHLTG